jgi:hypothetical protein
MEMCLRVMSNLLYRFFVLHCAWKGRSSRPRLFLLQLFIFFPGTAGYEPGKRCAADGKFHSVFLKSATIKVYLAFLRVNRVNNESYGTSTRPMWGKKFMSRNRACHNGSCSMVRLAPNSSEKFRTNSDPQQVR